PTGLGAAQLHARPRLPVGRHACAEVVLAPDLGVGDRLPEALRRRADVDLEHLLHWALQSVLEIAERGRPGLGVLADPSVVDEADGDGGEEVQLFPASPADSPEPRLLD